MLVGYGNTCVRSSAKTLRYSCLREAIDYGGGACQSLSGAALELFVVERLLQAMSPASLELSLAAAEDIEHERKQLDEHWQRRRAEFYHAPPRSSRRRFRCEWQIPGW